MEKRQTRGRLWLWNFFFLGLWVINPTWDPKPREKEWGRRAQMISDGGSVWAFRLSERLGQHHLRERALLKLEHQSGEFTTPLLLARLWRVLQPYP